MQKSITTPLHTALRHPTPPDQLEALKTVCLFRAEMPVGKPHRERVFSMSRSMQNRFCKAKGEPASFEWPTCTMNEIGAIWMIFQPRTTKTARESTKKIFCNFVSKVAKVCGASFSVSELSDFSGGRIWAAILCPFRWFSVSSVLPDYKMVPAFYL